jgi:hypothetical protein
MKGSRCYYRYMLVGIRNYLHQIGKNLFNGRNNLTCEDKKFCYEMEWIYLEVEEGKPVPSRVVGSWLG